MTNHVFTLVNTPVGLLQLIAKEARVTHVMWQNQHMEILNGQRVTREENNPALSQAREELEAYFAGKLTRFSIPLELEGTPFQKHVWQVLQSIPYGEVISYAELARMVDNPSAMRAVGNANGRNPAPVIVPCHRVIAANYGLGGYGGGLDIKRMLLEREGLSIDENDRVNRHVRQAA